jgi:hypothetical protein
VQQQKALSIYIYNLRQKKVRRKNRGKVWRTAIIHFWTDPYWLSCAMVIFKEILRLRGITAIKINCVVVNVMTLITRHKIAFYYSHSRQKIQRVGQWCSSIKIFYFKKRKWKKTYSHFLFNCQTMSHDFYYFLIWRWFISLLKPPPKKNCKEEKT